MVSDDTVRSPHSTSSSTSFVRWMVVGVALLNVIVFGLVAFSLTRSFGEYEERTEVTALNLSQMLAHDIGRELEKIDVMLLTAADEIRHQESQHSGIDAAALNAFLLRLQGRVPEVISMRVTDSEGIVVYGRNVDPHHRMNNSDREYFTRQRDNPEAGLVIGKPIFARIDKQWVITVSRALRRADGSFGGVVYVNIAQDHLAQAFSAIDVGQRGSVSLRDTGLRIFSHYPVPKEIERVLGQRLDVPELEALIRSGRDAGTYISDHTVDGVERKFAVHRISKFPLYAVVGRATEDYMARWRGLAAKTLLLAALFCLTTLISSWLIFRNWKRQRLATLELAREEEKFHTVADFTYDWEYWEGPKHEMLFMSPSCERVTGYSRNEFLADPGLLYHIIHPDDRHLMAAHQQNAAHAHETALDFRIVRRDGQIRWIAHGCQAVFGRDGKFMGRRTSNRDISERKEAEESLRATADRLNEAQRLVHLGSWTLDLTSGKLEWSDEIYRLFEIDPTQFGATYEAFLNAIHPDDRDAVNRAYTGSLASRTPYEITHRLLMADGRIKWVHERCTSEFDATGKPLRSSGTVQDISEQKQAEMQLDRYRLHLEELVEERTRQLAEAKEAAEAANRAKSIFLSNMSHELRTPLNAVLGFTQIMERDASIGDTHRRELATIGRSGRHLLSLINDVLEISRIEAGRTTVQNDAFDLDGTLTAVEEMIRVRAESKGLALRVERQGDLPPYVLGDAHHLRQVLINLLGNAVKFTDHGQVSLRVAADGERTLFEVADTGPGIAPADRERIFQAFFQTETGIAKGEGTGLGLTISREFVRLMGGELSVDSELGQGSRFRFTIPLPPTAAPAGVAQQGTILGLAPGQSAPRILVAEDRPDNQQVITELLNQTGFQVRIAADGRQALDLFQAWHPHLVLMDMRMPVMDGYEATRAIRALPEGKTIPIVALTASAFEEERSQILAMGCNEMVRKPIEQDQLFGIMGRLLELRYVYGEKAPVATPSLHDLCTLPTDLCAELAKAAAILDKDAALAIVGRLRADHPDEARALADLINAYRFDRVQELCDHR